MPAPTAGRLIRRFARNRRGAAALEFAFMAPIFLAVLAGMTDLGGGLFTRMSLDSAITAGSNYALMGADNVKSATGATLAQSIAGITGNGISASNGTVTVVVNNGPTTVLTGGVPTNSGTAANADLCYCPTISGTTITWGSAMTCNASCTGGGYAGKFVTIRAEQTYVPVFIGYPLFEADTVSAQAVIQVK